MPTPAVTAIASALQKTTRVTPGNTGALPARAAIPPSTASSTRAAVETAAITWPFPSHAAMRGSTPPVAKLSADAKAACRGLAFVLRLIPSSSRAWAASASRAASWVATWSASAGSSPRRT